MAKWSQFDEEDSTSVPGTEYFGAEDEMVTVSKVELLRLRDDSAFLKALMDVGVDNWEGYGEACLSHADLEEEE